MRSKGHTHQQQVLLERADNNLYAVYDSLNYVSSCPWKINKKVSGMEWFMFH